MNPHPLQAQQQLNFRNELHVDREQEVIRFNEIFTATYQSAVLQIRALGGLGKSWLLQKMAYDSQKTNPTTTFCYVDFGDPIWENNIQGAIDVIFEMREELITSCKFSQFDAALQPYLKRSQRMDSQVLLTLAEKLNKCLTPVNPTSRMNLSRLAMAVKVDLAAITPANAIFFEEVMALVNHVADPSVAKLPQLIAAIPTHWADNVKAKEIDWQIEPEQHKIPETDYGELSVWINNLPRAELEIAHQSCTTAFLADLRAYQAQGMRVLFLFDNYDSLLGDAARWMQKEFLKQLDQGNLPNVVVIVAGYSRLLDFESTNYPQVFNVLVDGLSPFTPDQVREFYMAHNVSPELLEALVVMSSTLKKPGYPKELNGLLSNFAIEAKK